MRDQLRGGGVTESVIDDAVLILSELLSNACRHGRPLGDALTGDGDGDVLAAWRVDGGGRLVVEVTDGGGPTRPAPATPSVSAHGGRGLNIITALAEDWGVRDDARGEVTVWVIVHADVHDPDARCRREDFTARVTAPAVPALHGLAGLDGLDSLDGLESLDCLDGLGFAGPSFEGGRG
jgi:anti-sigma regulatory factor (Ser/Thr protein kinase)